MAIPRWQPGRFYRPGSVVRRTSSSAVVQGLLANPNFNDGDTGWDVSAAGASIVNTPGFNGGWVGRATNQSGSATIDTIDLINDTIGPVTPGQRVTAVAYIYGFRQTISGVLAIGAIGLQWLDGSSNVISEQATTQSSGSSLAWRVGQHSAIAPAGAVGVRLFLRAFVNGGGGQVDFDQVTWTVASQDQAAPGNLVFRAIQPEGAFSDSSEPVWPTVVGDTVVDGGVTWEAFIANRVQWTAFPLLRSGSTEPNWPTVPGASVVDGTIAWEAFNGQITDPRCPNSKVVAIASSKVYAADGDIIKFSATVNPRDWSSQDDAGFLPFGLQTYGSNPVAALGLYRGNLVAFNSSGFQMWQVDEDPVNMALLDAVPVASTYHPTIQPMSNELFFLSNLGVRTIGIAGASTNLQADDIGRPIDMLVRAALNEDPNPKALFYPGAGQYWLIFGAQAFVLTINGARREDRSWTRYIFPDPIEDWTQLDNMLYLKTADRVLMVDNDSLDDDGVDFDGAMQWHWLDMGEPGRMKMMIGYDLVGSGEVSVEFGFDQTNLSAFTDPYTVDADTLPDEPVPFPLSATTFSMKLTFAEGQDWEWNAATMYFQDKARMAR